MAFTKHAYADAHVLEIKGAPTKVRTASLDTVGDFANYRTDDGYMYVRIRAISSRVNKNHDGWPTTELAGSADILNQHKHSSDGFTVEAKDGNKARGFATFVGKPIFVDHNNTDPRRGRGVIVDSKFRILDQKTAAADDYWKSADVDPEHLPASEIELLLEVDAKQYPKFAKAIRNGDLDGFSMGANVEYTKCSHCGNEAHDPTEFCSHVLMKGAHHDFKDSSTGKRISKRSYENCYGCGFFEISGVFDPADETALAREVRASIEKEGDLYNGAPAGIDPGVDPLRGTQDDWVQTYAQYLQNHYGYDPATALQVAQTKTGDPVGEQVHGEGVSPHDYMTKSDPSQDPLFNDLNLADAVEDHGVRNDPRWSHTASFQDPFRRVAENPLPQSMMTKAPDEVDTLRQDQICPVCGNQMEGEQCDVCGYVQPPKEFDNPDLTKAQEVRDEMKQQDDAESNPQSPAPDPGADQQGAAAAPGAPSPSPTPAKPQVAARVTDDRIMRNWTPKVNARVAARINQVERPVRTGQTTNEPQGEVVLSDQTRPVTSAMRTAQQLIAAAKINSGETMSTRTADGPTPPGDTSADARVDVNGVGGVMDASNEEASRADAQVDVTGIGGTGVEGVEADSTESLPTAGESSDDSGFDTEKTTDDSGPTSTYGDSDGSHSGVGDPVTSETPYWVDESKWSHVSLSADGDDKTLEEQEQQGDPVAGGGAAKSGTEPADPVGKADERVNVLEHKTTPANNSGETKTWSGTDGNGVTKMQPPVTQESQEWGGVKVPDVKLHTQSAHFINCDRLASLEEDLGLLAHDDRWNRLASLHQTEPSVVKVRIETLSQVKTAGTKLAAQHKLATRIPRGFGQTTAASHDFERIASTQQKESAVSDSDLDAALFTR